MAKRAPSKHSRAARRATSPGIDLDKSLKTAKPPAATVNERPSVLGIHQAAGVSKKIRKQTRKSVLSSKARKRQMRGLDRAAAIMERTAQKVQRSKSQARVIDSRRKAWDDINDQITEGVVDSSVPATKNGNTEKEEEDESKDSGDEAVKRFYGDLDEDMDEASTPATATTGTETLPTMVASMQIEQENEAAAAAKANDDDIL